MKFSPTLVDLVNASAIVNRLKVEHRIQMDNTTFVDWNGCFVKGLYTDGLRKVPAGGVAPLVFGQAVHTGMKALMLGEPLEAALEKAQADATVNNLDMLLDSRRNSSSLSLLLNSYVEHTNIMTDEWLVPVELNGKKIVEETFSFPIGKLHFKAGELLDEACEIEVWWSGILDALVYYRNEIWVCDHKTTSVMGDKFVDDKLRSSQMLGYTMIGRLMEKFLSKPVRGVLINALALRKNDFEFKLFPLPMAEWKIQEWQSETLLAMRNLVLNLVGFLSTGEAAPIREHCVTKYGKCKFFDLCENVPLVRDRMILDENLFSDNKWHPIE